MSAAMAGPAVQMGYHHVTVSGDVAACLAPASSNARLCSSRISRISQVTGPALPIGANAQTSFPGSQVLTSRQPSFHTGSSVEYNSVTHGGWLPAKVTAYHPATQLYDLDCKAQVPLSKLRKPGNSNTTSSGLPAFSAGQNLRTTQPAEAFAPSGAAMQKTAYTSARVVQRVVQPAKGAATFPVGCEVEYHSSTLGRWISTKVLSFDPITGLYDLECKPQVAATKMRQLQTDPSPSSSSSCQTGRDQGSDQLNSLEVGSRVEVLYEGSWLAGTIRGLPSMDAAGIGRWSVQCDEDDQGCLTLVHQIRPLLRERSDSHHVQSTECFESAGASSTSKLEVGSRVEAFYEGEWYTGTLVRTLEQDGKGIVQHVVKCDADPDDCLTQVLEIRLLSDNHSGDVSSTTPGSSPTAGSGSPTSEAKQREVVLKKATLSDGQERILVSDREGKELASFGQSEIEFELKADPTELSSWLKSLDQCVMPGLLSLLGSEVGARGSKLQAAEKERDEFKGVEDYEFFGLSTSVTDQDLVKAYRKQSTRLHPDKGGDEADFNDMRQRYERLQKLRGIEKEKNKGGGGRITYDPDDRDSMLHAHEEFRLQLVYITRELQKVEADLQELRHRNSAAPQCLMDAPMQPATGGA
eukprot:TRINITY_DN19428_c0_g1_i1.p1 TRINITY_DN19428_c0_g1~~TRINITY_DN19428_c0_g1_i1.p1  ORF type:complete len:637 (+),score=108.60 TRINITY_DN19428_c0_g1_i1:28-1938(+)